MFPTFGHFTILLYTRYLRGERCIVFLEAALYLVAVYLSAVDHDSFCQNWYSHPQALKKTPKNKKMLKKKKS
jgi:hypothetical protein